ncbi:MAG: CBS domain-containing protein [Thermodesulfobacteriota bacterium]
MDIITTHKSSDFDALASVIAGTLLYPGAVAVLPKTINPNAKGFLSIHKDLFDIRTPDDIDMAEVKRLIVVDANSWGRLEVGKLKGRTDIEVIVWDHHPNGDIQAAWECKEEMGANITLMVREMKKQHKILTPMQATLFLAGLYEDTGNLSFPSTTAEDAYTAGFLLDRKADLNILSTFLRPGYGEKQKNILFQMLQKAERMKVGGFTISCNAIEISGHVGNLSLVVHMYREILNVDAAFGIFSDREHNRSIVIGRSNVDELNVGLMMRSMGGGGHPGAASAMIKSASPEAIKDWIIELIEGNQQSSVRVSDLMSYPVLAIPSDTTMSQTAKILREKGCTGLPVVDNGRLVGVISRRDFHKVRNNQLKAPVKAFMSRETVTIGPDRSPVEAARLMVKHDIGRLPVVDKGEIIGIVTRTDAMMYFYDLLPD